MKRRQIAALALACMLMLTSFTTYAENGTKPENPALLLDEDVSLETESETTEIETEESETAEGEETEATFEEETEMTSEEETENTIIETETEETEELVTEEESDSSDTSEQKTEESVSETTLNSEASDGSQTVAAALTETTEEPQIESETESESETEEQIEAAAETESESETEEQTEPETEIVTSEEDTGDEFILTKDNEGDFLDKFDPSTSLAEEICLNYIEYGKIEGIEEIYYCLWDDEFCYSFSGLPFTHAFTDLSYASDYTGFGGVDEYYDYGLSIWLKEETVTKDVTLGILLVKDDGSYTWDTVRIYGNENAEHVDMLYPFENCSLFLTSNKIEEFTFIYPKDVNKEDIEAIGYCLWDDGCSYSIGDMPYMHGLSCHGYYGDDLCVTCYVAVDGFVLIREKYALYVLTVCIRCKDGRTFYDHLGIYFDEEYVSPDNGIYPEYVKYWIYLEKGQTAYIEGRELGFCQERYIGTFYGMDYETYNVFLYKNLDQDPKIKMDRFTFEIVKTGFEFVAEKNGETVFGINGCCMYEDGTEIAHRHEPMIGVIISEPGKGEYAPGIYDRFGNLKRAFDEDIVSNDQNTKPESGKSESQSAVTPNTSSSKVESPATGDSDGMRIRNLMLLCACVTILIYLSEKREKQ